MKTHKHNEKEPCAVCGAAVRGIRIFRRNTCDNLCHRAKATGRTRAGQIKAEMQEATRVERARELSDRLYERILRQATNNLDYNRPYMKAATA